MRADKAARSGLRVKNRRRAKNELRKKPAGEIESAHEAIV